MQLSRNIKANIYFLFISIYKLKMGKRYYCDFCDRSFADNAENRKKHLNGVQHQRLKKLHYDSFRDAAAILADEMSKKPCKRFHQTGQCDFGGSCRFSHLTAEDIQQLRNQMEYDKRKHLTSHSIPDTVKHLELWLAKRAKKQASSESDVQGSVEPSFCEWTLPPELQTFSNLPPSVLPPSPIDFTTENLNEWG